MSMAAFSIHAQAATLLACGVVLTIPVAYLAHEFQGLKSELGTAKRRPTMLRVLFVEMVLCVVLQVPGVVFVALVVDSTEWVLTVRSILKHAALIPFAWTLCARFVANFWFDLIHRLVRRFWLIYFDLKMTQVLLCSCPIILFQEKTCAHKSD